MIKNYIFDFYGTLVDVHTEESKQEVWNKLIDIYQSFGISYSLQEIKDAYSLLCQKEIKRLESKTGYEYPEIDLLNVFGDLFLKNLDNTFFQKNKFERKDILYDIAKQFRETSRDYCKLYPNTLEVLKILKQRHKKIYLLSNAQRCFTLEEIEMVGIKDYFDEIYISSDYSMKKPQKEFLSLCLRQNNLNKEETIMIGNEVDSDIQVAYLNDVKSILLNTDHKTKDEIQKDLEIYHDKNYDPTVIYSGNMKEILEVQ